MARAAQRMTEEDAGLGGGADDLADLDNISAGRDRSTSLPEGLANYRDSPNQGSPRQGAPPEGELDFDIVDTDEAGNALNGADRGGGSPDPRMNDEGEGTFLERRAADENRRQRLSNREQRALRRQGRDRTFAENQALRNELAELRAKVAAVEPRLFEIDHARIRDQIGSVDQQITHAANVAAEAKRRLTQALAAGDADAVATAMDEREQALMRGTQLANAKAQLETQFRSQGGQSSGDQRQPEPQGVPVPPPLPRVVQQYVQEFSDDHPWFNPQERDGTGRPRDPDTRIAMQLDQDVAAEGYQPNTQDYWDELNDRLRRYLPHRFAGERVAPQQQQRRDPREPQTQPQRRGPMTAGGAERPVQQGNRQSVYLTPARKEALIAAGVLNRDGKTVEDRAKFNRYLNGYRKFDSENAT